MEQITLIPLIDYNSPQLVSCVMVIITLAPITTKKYNDGRICAIAP